MELPVRVLPVVALAVLCGACAPKADAPAGGGTGGAPVALTAAELDAVKAVETAWAAGMNAKDTAAVFATYTADAKVLPPDSPILTGADGRAALAGLMAAGAGDFVLTPVEVYGSGDLAYAVGTASYTLGGATHTAKYLEVFRKGADGKWQYVADAFSGVAPAAGAQH